MIKRFSRQALQKRALQTIAIRREDIDWERRAAFTPDQVGQILRDNPDCRVLVQPSNQRCFNIQDYIKNGAIEQEDISSADLIIGVKQVPIECLHNDKTYAFFSHTIKGQPDNMPMLDAILDKNIRLVDYEKIQVDGVGKRMVAFGKWAGVAGAIDILHCLGLRLQALKMDSPFFKIGRAHNYKSVEDCYEYLETEIKPQLEAFGRKRQRPFTFVCTGNGNVSQGAQEVLGKLGVVWVPPMELKSVKNNPIDYDKSKIYASVVDLKDHLSHKQSGSFSVTDFFQNPSDYASVFSSEIAPYTNVLINGIIWYPGHPRLLSNQDLQDCKDLYAVADITADHDGSLEFMKTCTSLDDPYRFFNTKDQTYFTGLTGEPGFCYSSVDNLPTQVAPEASEYFGSKLMPFVKSMLQASNTEKSLQTLFSEKLQPEIANAIIASDGKLAPRYENIAQLRKSNDNGQKKVLVLGAGMVTGPLISYLDKHNIAITLASQNFAEASTLADRCNANYVTPIELDMMNETPRLNQLVADHDLVISLVPYTLHHLVCEAAVSTKTNMMTASYESDKMKEYEQDMRNAGIFCVNELGLDPGIDHMLAMECFDNVRDNNGEIKSFISFCGGLPAPEASDNALGYKFSWSPRGVLMAAMNPAIYQYKNDFVERQPGGEILKNRIDTEFYKGFNLEAIANRDSLKYKEPYSLENVETILRGTLRYQGYCDLVYGLKTIGLCSADKTIPESATSWADYLASFDYKATLASDANNAAHMEMIISGMQDLGLFSSQPFADNVRSQDNVLDAFAMHLANNCDYKEGERDLVLLRHEIISEDKSGKRDLHEIDFVHYGDREWSAMAKTVSLPLAICARFALENKFENQENMQGLIRPLEKSVYKPILAELRAMSLDSRYNVSAEK